MHFITKAMPIDTINVKHDVKRLKTVELYKMVIKASFHVNVYLRIAFWENIHTSQTKEIFKMQLVHASSGVATVGPSGALAPPSASVAPPSGSRLIT